MPVHTYLSVVLDESGTHFLSCGLNSRGQLGTGDLATKHTFTRVNLPTKFSSISPGYENFCVGIAEEDGSLWSWGSNFHGQLGISKEIKQVSIPAQIPNTQRFIQVSSGNSFALCLDEDGHVWVFGRNVLGQLGLGDKENRNTPTMNEHLSHISFISSGYRHGIALDSHGEAWSFGSNNGGQLGVGDKTDRNIPCKVSGVNQILQVSCGYYHNLLLDSQSRVWSCGDNSFGQLGHGDTQCRLKPEMIQNLENISQVYCGGNHSIVKDIHQRVFIIGDNSYDQFDVETTASIHSPILKESWNNKIILPGGFHTAIGDDQGKLSIFGHFGFPFCKGEQNIKVKLREQISGRRSISKVKRAPASEIL
jgi:alpha-tubulin suppressor-like RCC1 family protein